MRITVLLFAHLKEIVGRERLDLEVDENSHGIDVLNKVIEQFPAVEGQRKYLSMSMNGKYITGNVPVVENAEIAIFPPVSGG